MIGYDISISATAILVQLAKRKELVHNKPQLKPFKNLSG